MSSPSFVRPVRRAVLCGVSNYGPNGWRNPAISEEVSDLRTVLTSGLHPDYRFDSVDVHLDEALTLGHLQDVLDELQTPNPVEELFLLIAGQGVVHRNEPYFRTYGATRSAAGMLMSRLAQDLEGIAAATRTVAILDFCFSGAVTRALPTGLPQLGVLASAQEDQLAALGDPGESSFTRVVISALTEAPTQNGLIHWGDVAMHSLRAMERSLRQTPDDRIDRLRLRVANVVPANKPFSNTGGPSVVNRPMLYFRRRCRIAIAGSDSFQRIFRDYAREQPFDAPSIETMASPSTFEAVMLEAAQHEGAGRPEEMLRCLGGAEFEGLEETCRLFYEGVALEKNHLLPEAINVYTTVLGRTDRDDLATAADFNMRVCYEKLNRFDSADFRRYLEDQSRKIGTDEYLWHKALSMEIICCAKSGREFQYEALVDQALSEESQTSSGYWKLLMNWRGYREEPLSDEEIEIVLDARRGIGVSARVGVLYQVASQLERQARWDDAAPLRNEISVLARETGSDSARRFLE